MDKLIKETVSIIEDYRNDDDIFIDKKHVKSWINQFEEDDQEFLLTELNLILPKCYISKKDVIKELDDIFEYLAKQYKFGSISDFLSEVRILSCQGRNKSQTLILSFLDEIIKEKYKISLNECGKENPKYWLYIDDTLASGGTFKRDIEQKINEFGVKDFGKSSIKIIAILFFLHEWGQSNSVYSLGKKLELDLSRKIDFHFINRIENDPRISRYNPDPLFNNVYSKKSEIGEEFINNLEGKLRLKYPMTQEDKAFRDPRYPKNEEFFSSPDNRDRYENIILKKGIEIFNKIENIEALGTRPLGFTPPTYKTLGTGGHAFTWRNISNTCPLVFWWENHGWKPLFSVANRGR